GSASHGPLFAGVTGEGAGRPGVAGFVDIRTFKVHPVALEGPAKALTYYEGGTFRASANGHVFTAWRTDTSAQFVSTMQLSGLRLKAQMEVETMGHLVPGPDGRFLFTIRGTRSTQAKPDDDTGKVRPIEYVLPAHHGDYYLRLP